MNFKNSSKLLLLTGAAFVAPQAQAIDDNDLWDQPADWSRHFRIGMQLGLNIKAKFKTAGTFNIGGVGQGSDGYRFDDGYVLKDISGDPNETWNWGYDDPDQLVGNTLTFQRTSSYEVQNTGTRTKGDEPYIGFDLGYGWTFGALGSARLGAEFGFGLLPISISDRDPLIATLTGEEATVDAPGVILPAGGYHGSFEGPGVMIPRNVILGPGFSETGPVSGSRTLDAMFYNFRLGPTLFWELNPKFGVGVGAGGAFGIVSGDYKFNERPSGSSGASFKGKFGETDFVYGGYVNALATYRIEQSGDIFLGVQYMPLTDATFKQGGREAKLDLSSGIYITTGINWPF